LLAIYGSLVPFKYTPVTWDAAFEQWHRVRLVPLTVHSRTDFAANVLLFIPLAFFWMGALCADRPRSSGWLWAILLIPAGAALSAAIEFTQIFFPPRVPTGSDIVGETTGGVLGVLCWLIAGQRITTWARMLAAAWRSSDVPALLLPAYLIALVVIHVLPLNLTLSPVEIYHKYRDGMIILNPFHTMPSDNVFQVAEKHLWKLVYFVPVGCMLAYLPPTSWQQRKNWRRVLLAGVALTALTEFLKLFVIDRYFYTGHLFVGTLGVMAGWCAIRAVRTGRFRFFPGPVWLAVAFILWLTFVVITTWQPFTFNFEATFVEVQWGKVSFIPFADYHRGEVYNAFDQFFHKVLLYVPLGVFLSRLTVRRLKYAGILATILGLAVAAFFELGQLYLPGRYASITDILVETLGVWLGFRIATAYAAEGNSRAGGQHAFDA
jgi:glycopeptide antibiotics resistance protein